MNTPDYVTENVIETHGLSKSYKGVQALKIAGPAGAAALDLRLPGAQRRGEDHDDQAAARPGAADRRQRPGVRPGHREGKRRDPAAGRLPGPGSALLRVHDRPRDPALHRPLLLRGARRRRSRQRVAETLELVGLADKADRPVKGFSGGERQRLGIAQAQVNYPDLLILDEPAASLDPMGRHDVLEVMERLRKHTTIFYSTHILDDVQRVSDTVVILNQRRAGGAGADRGGAGVGANDIVHLDRQGRQRGGRSPPAQPALGDGPRRRCRATAG